MDNRKKIYDQVSKHADIGSYDSFNKAMDDPTRRKSFFEKTSSLVDFGGWDKFNSFVGQDEESKKQLEKDKQQVAQQVASQKPSLLSGLENVFATFTSPKDQIEKGISQLQDNPIAGTVQVGMGIANAAFSATGVPAAFAVIGSVARKLGYKEAADNWDSLMNLPSKAVDLGTKGVEKGLETIGLDRPKQEQFIKDVVVGALKTGQPEAKLLLPLLTTKGQQEISDSFDELNKTIATIGTFAKLGSLMPETVPETKVIEKPKTSEVKDASKKQSTEPISELGVRTQLGEEAWVRQPDQEIATTRQGEGQEEKVVSTAVETPEGVVTGDKPFDAHDSIIKENKIPEEIYTTKQPNMWQTQLGYERGGKAPQYLYLAEVKNPSKESSYYGHETVSPQNEVKIVQKLGKDLELTGGKDEPVDLGSLEIAREKYAKNNNIPLENVEYHWSNNPNLIGAKPLEENRGFIVEDVQGNQSFVGREEAAKVAEQAGQIAEPVKELHSEDLRKQEMPSLIREIDSQPIPETAKQHQQVSEKIINTVANLIGGEQTKQLASINKLDGYYNFIKNSIKRSPTKQMLPQLTDAIYNLAYNRGEQTGNYFKKLVESPADREAISLMVDSGNTLDALKLEAEKAVGTQYSTKYDYAIQNFDKLKDVASEVKATTDAQIAREKSYGIDTKYRENYVPRLIDEAEDLSEPFQRTGGQGTRYFTKERVFDTIGDAVKAGKTLKTLDIANLLQNRIRNGELNVEQKQYLATLKNMKDPVSGLPISADAIKDRAGNTVPPRDYVPVTVFGRQTIYVHKGFSGLMRALFADDAIKNSMIGNFLLQFEGTLKHSVLGLDTFHVSRMAQLGTAMKGDPTYGKGLSLVEYNDRTLDIMKASGEIDQATVDYAKQVRPVYDELTKSGLNIGKHTENLELGLVAKIPGLKQFNNFTFQKLTRGIMAESAIKMFEKNLNTYGAEMTREQILSKTVKEANTYFANLGKQGIFKNPTWQSLSRIFLLAPNWFESGIRRELSGLKQTAQVPYDIATKGKLRVGNAGRALGALTMGYIGANQVINYITRGHSTFENPEEGHKFDAWIPGGENGYWISPLSVSYELSNDIKRYFETNENLNESATRILENKLSPIGRFAKTELTGRDYRGKKLEGMELQKEALKSLEPTPLAFRGFTTGRDIERQLFASAGLKIEPQYNIGNTLAEKEMLKIVRSKGEFFLTTEEQDKYKAMQELSKKLKNNTLTKEDEEKARKVGIIDEEGTLSKSDFQKLNKMTQNTPAQLMFKRLTAEEATKVWDLMGDKEKELYQKAYDTKLKNAEKAKKRGGTLEEAGKSTVKRRRKSL